MQAYEGAPLVEPGSSELRNEGTMLIRGGIESRTHPWDSGLVEEERLGKRRRDEWKGEQSLHLTTVPPNIEVVAGQAMPVRWRVCTRTLIRTYGWPIRSFISPLELVTTIRDAVRGTLLLRQLANVIGSMN